jgi:aspartate aminotransferase
LQSHSTSNPTTPSQWASIAALEGDDSAIDTMKEAFVARKKVMINRLNTIDGISCVNPQGAFYAFPNISKHLGKTSAQGTSIQHSVDFCKALLQEELVACVPGSGFGAEGYIRLSYATSMEAINAALDRLETFVKGLK